MSPSYERPLLFVFDFAILQKNIEHSQGILLDSLITFVTKLQELTELNDTETINDLEVSSRQTNIYN